MTLINTISTELDKLNPEYPAKKFILAISGGVDSMVLLDGFNKLSLNIEVAHFNFQLRGKESDADEKLVKEICSKNNIPFNKNTANTNAYAAEKGLSIQEAARELRYNWFFNLLKDKNADYIVTGHNADDSIETFFINLLRGSGIKGLCGIKNTQQIVRPLLPVYRLDIEDYAKNNNVSFRNDSSNESLKYKRNFIRKKIIPELNKEIEASSSSILKSIGHLTQANEYLEKKLVEDAEKITYTAGSTIFIETKQLIENIVLYSALRKYGFNQSQVKSIQSDTQAIGKKHYSSTHVLLVDRNHLAIQPLKNQLAEVFEIPSLGNYNIPFPISLNIIDKPHSLRTENNAIFIDADTIKFPLIIRKWEEGDSFVPFGMKGKKKLSDFFIDEKFSQFEKKDSWLLMSDNEIVWLINHRLDDRHKVSSITTNFLQIET
jgi:tRNA(Ile)-lysidine synthase